MNHTSEQVWQRAQNIAHCGVLRINTVDELDHEYETKHQLRIFHEAEEAELQIKRQLIDLYSDRRAYIEALDTIADAAAKSGQDTRKFWDSIMEIALKENDQFKLERQKPRQK